MEYRTVATDAELAALCQDLAAAPVMGFDTEFVSEDTYRSQLCLLQVVTPAETTLIDPVGIRDITPFWQTLADRQQDTVVHAGREELVFSLTALSRPPGKLFDVQLAAGLVGTEYPSGYSSLVLKLLGQRIPKGETRTDWRRRPLSRQQIEYALADVAYLLPMRQKLEELFGRMNRQAWLDEEMAAWQADIGAYLTRPRWRRTSGISGLSAKSLAIVRELWAWREEQARRCNQPVKRILRDDLIVEMAKRATADPKRILAIRGLDRGDLRRALPDLVAAIERGLANPEPASPKSHVGDLPPQLTLLGQYLAAALSSICHQARVAPSLAGTASDVRDLIAFRLGLADGKLPPPKLTQGWRAKVVGNVIDDLLSGKLSIRIRDPQSEDPLAFEQNVV